MTTNDIETLDLCPDPFRESLATALGLSEYNDPQLIERADQLRHEADALTEERNDLLVEVPRLQKIEEAARALMEKVVDTGANEHLAELQAALEPEQAWP